MLYVSLTTNSSFLVLIGIVIRLWEFLVCSDITVWGTGISRLIRGMATLPQGNQEILLVKDKVGRPSGELGVIKSMECDIFPFSAFDTTGWATGRASGL